MMKRFLTVFLMSLLVAAVSSINVQAQQQASQPQAQQPPSNVSLDALLRQVKQGRVRENRENTQREQEFRRDQARQQQMLDDAKKERAALEAQSAKMEAEFDKNELEISDQQNLLTKRLGSLKELFGVLQQAAGDARGEFDSSLTNIQYPNRGKFLTALAEKMGSSTKLATIEEIERLWYELEREMVESGKVVKFKTKVVMAGGDEAVKDVIRVGVFNLISDGKYLKYDTDTGKVSELLRQPQDRYVESAQELTKASSGLVTVGLDPTRGQLLGMLVDEPTWIERATTQGGTVGWIIIYLGGFALIIVIFRFIQMFLLSAAVTAQRRNITKPSKGNPLGRVLQVYYDNKNIDVESLELKLGEAVLKEVPRINRFNALLKVIAAVSPLLGLLGTVTGMIITFQAITLFGTGDPKLMAGGISQALVTTYLGLVVAIPTVFMHSLIAGRSKRVVEVIEEQATGLVAEASEKAHSA